MAATDGPTNVDTTVADSGAQPVINTTVLIIIVAAAGTCVAVILLVTFICVCIFR